MNWNRSIVCEIYWLHVTTIKKQSSW